MSVFVFSVVQNLFPLAIDPGLSIIIYKNRIAVKKQ